MNKEESSIQKVILSEIPLRDIKEHDTLHVVDRLYGVNDFFTWIPENTLCEIVDSIKKGNKLRTEKEIIMLMGKSSSKKISQKKEVI